MTNQIATWSGVISVALALYCSIPYWRSIVAGRTRPHQFSWLVFTIMNGIVTISQFLAGGRASVLISLTFFFASGINFVLSLRYGTRNTSRLDSGLFIFALFTIVLWIFTKNNAVAIWLSVCIDIFATSMIVMKIRAHHDSEALLPWSIGGAAFVFSCISLVGTPFGVLYVRPIYGLLSDLAIILPLICYQRSRKQSGPVTIQAN